MLPFFCLPNFLHFFLSLLAFNELFIYLLFYLSLTLSRVGELKTSTFSLFLFASHTLIFFYISFFGYVCSALHRDFKRVYVTVFCVYSPLCRCFLSVLPPLGLFLLLMLLLFLTSFFSRLKKRGHAWSVTARARGETGFEPRKREVGREDRCDDERSYTQKRNDELETTTTHKKR